MFTYDPEFESAVQKATARIDSLGVIGCVKELTDIATGRAVYSVTFCVAGFFLRGTYASKSDLDNDTPIEVGLYHIINPLGLLP